MGTRIKALCVQLASARKPPLRRLLWGVVVLLFCLLGIVQEFSRDPNIIDPDSSSFFLTIAAYGSPAFVGGLLLGTIPNFLHQWIVAHFNSRLRSSKTFFSNHDLSRAVGESLRLILLDTADPQPGDNPRVTSADARNWLRSHAVDAPQMWLTFVEKEADDPESEYRALFETHLWRFVEHRDAPVLRAGDWAKLLTYLNGGTTLPFASDAAAMTAIEERLNRRFGEALWEYTKNDFVNGGAEAKAISLLIASQLLRRTTEMANGIEGLKTALADLVTEWRTREDAVFKEVEKHTKRQAWAMRLLVANAKTLDRIEDKIEDLGATNREAHAVTHKKLDDIARSRVSPLVLTPPDNLTAASVPNNAAKFRGRVGDLEELHRRVTSDPDGVPIPVIAAPGLGKSALVTRYVYLHRADFDHIWWLRASNPTGQTSDSVEERSLAALLDFWGIESRALQGDASTARVDVLAARVRAWLSVPRPDGAPTRHLIVLDNVDDYATVKRLRLNSPSRVVFTARAPHLARDGAVAMRLEALLPQDGVLVLRSKTTRWHEDIFDAPLAEIGELVGWNALALVYLSAVLVRPSTQSPASLRDALRTSLVTGGAGPMGHSHETERPDDHDQRVEEAFALFIGPFAERAEMTVLDVAALCAPDHIPVDLLRESSGLSPESFGEALDELVGAGVLDFDNYSTSIHRLTQVGVKRDMGLCRPGALRVVLKRFLNALLDVYQCPASMGEEHRDHLMTPKRLSVVPHAEAVIVHAVTYINEVKEGTSAVPIRPSLASARKTVSDLSERVAALRGAMANWLPVVGMHAAAERHVDAAIDWGEAQSPRDERPLAILYATRARISRNPEKAEKDINKSIDWGEAQYPREELALSIWYAQRAQVRMDRGMRREANDDIAKSISWSEAQVPRDERHLSVLYSVRTRISQENVVRDKAEEDIAKSLKWAEEQSPRDERLLAILYADRANIRQALGILEQAEDDITKSINWAEGQAQRDDRALSGWYYLRALIRNRCDMFNKAEGDITKSIELAEVDSSRCDRRLANFYALRAGIRKDLEMLKEAENDIAKSIEWGEAQSPRAEQGLAGYYTVRARILEMQAIAARSSGEAHTAAALFGKAKGDIAAALKWFETSRSSDVESITILRGDQARIDAFARGEEEPFFGSGGGHE